MRTAPPGTLLKSHRASVGTLSPSPQSRRLTEHLHDLITIAFEAFTNRPSNSLTLTRLEYVSGEKNGEKYSMRFAALVREADLPAGVPILLNITAEEDQSCLAQF